MGAARRRGQTTCLQQRAQGAPPSARLSGKQGSLIVENFVDCNAHVGTAALGPSRRAKLAWVFVGSCTNSRARRGFAPLDSRGRLSLRKSSERMIDGFLFFCCQPSRRTLF